MSFTQSLYIKTISPEAAQRPNQLGHELGTDWYRGGHADLLLYKAYMAPQAQARE